MYSQYLITGATGFLGRAVVSELIKQGAAVRVLILPNDPYASLLPKQVHVSIGNICDVRSLTSFFANADHDTCVIHCAGIVSISSKPPKSLYKVNVGGTNNMIRQCMKHKIGRFIYVSSVHAIPKKPMDTIIMETYRFSPDLVEGHYAKSKACATALAIKASFSGLNTCIVFPSGLIGPGDAAQGSFTTMAKRYISGKMPFSVQGGYDFVDVRDVAKGIVDCAEHGRSGNCYILSGHYIKMKNLLRLMDKATHVSHIRIMLPTGLAKIAASFYEAFCLIRKKPLFFTPYSISVLSSNGKFSHATASVHFKYKPRPIAESIKDTVKWLRKEDV